MLAEESLADLLKDPAHWGFEFVTFFVFEGLLGLLAWTKLIKPHIHKDVEHAGHGHDPHEEHPEVSVERFTGVDTSDLGEVDKAIQAALWHLDNGDPEMAYNVLTDLLEGK